AIHGACVGGGFELALACHWRIATDTPATQVGFPETGLGTIPGWGGCVRLPRLVGAKAALDAILKARLLGAGEACRAGFVDELVAPADLRSQASAAALRLATAGFPPRENLVAEAIDFAELRARTRERPAALRAAIGVVERAATVPLSAAL